MKIEVEILSYTSYIEVDAILYGYDNAGLSIVIDKSHDDSALELMPNTSNAIECTVPSYAGFKSDINDNWFVEIDSYYINAFKVRRLQIIDGSNTKLIFNGTQYLNVAETLVNCVTALNSVIDRPAGGGSGTGTSSDSEILYNHGGTVDGVSNVYSDGDQFLRVSDGSPVLFDFDLRGGAADTNSRITVISTFASPNAGSFISGEPFDNAFHANNTTVRSGVTNDAELVDFFVPENVDIDQIGVSVSTGAASSEMKIMIYASGTDGWPDALLKETAGIATISGGYRFEAQSPPVTLYPGVKYWVGWRFSGAPSVRVIALGSAINLGPAGTSGNTYYTILRRSILYSSPAPSNWVFSPTERVAAITPPLIRFRKA